MKKITMLFLALTALAMAEAQTTKEEARRIVLGQPKNGTTTQQGRTVILGRNEENRKVYRTKRTGYYTKKSNPGKHLGWYKGEGNPHRYGTNQGKGKKKG
jgi:hypothetical protein